MPAAACMWAGAHLRRETSVGAAAERRLAPHSYAAAACAPGLCGDHSVTAECVIGTAPCCHRAAVATSNTMVRCAPGRSCASQSILHRQISLVTRNSSRPLWRPVQNCMRWTRAFSKTTAKRPCDRAHAVPPAAVMMIDIAGTGAAPVRPGSWPSSSPRHIYVPMVVYSCCATHSKL